MTQKTARTMSHAPLPAPRPAFPVQMAVLLVLASVMLSTLVGCSRDPKVQAEKHYARAEKFLKENNPDAAIIELRSAIQLNPKLAKAHFELANIELQRGAPQIAFQEYVATTRADQQASRRPKSWWVKSWRGPATFSEAKGQAQLILSNWPDEKLGHCCWPRAVLACRTTRRRKA